MFPSTKNRLIPSSFSKQSDKIPLHAMSQPGLAPAGLSDTLYNTLSDWRKRVSSEIQKPAFIVASNALLESISRNRPRTRAELLAVSGLGPAKVEQYGNAILQITTDSKWDGLVHTAAVAVSQHPKLPEAAAQGTVPADNPLLVELKKWRLNLSREKEVKAYRIASNALLEAIVHRRPQTHADLHVISGYGTAKMEFSDAILRMTRDSKWDSLAPWSSEAAMASCPAPAGGTFAPPIGAVSNNACPLLADLKRWRKTKSGEDQKPAFMIAPEPALEEIARKRPSTLSQLAAIRGLDANQVKQSGKDLLELIEYHTQLSSLKRPAHQNVCAEPPASKASRPHEPLAMSLSSSQAASVHDALRQQAAREARYQPTPDAVGMTLTSRPLTAEQQHVVDEAMAGSSIFFTGSAGVGKSLVLRAVVAALRRRYPSEGAVQVCAPTGIAAILVEGFTVHKFAGCGLAKGSAGGLAAHIQKSPKALQRWLDTTVLVIDEVSMLEGLFFSKLEEVARILRNNNRPFGGIQLVLCGDFFQLPPVAQWQGQPDFIFRTPAWRSCVRVMIELTQVHRQSDQNFVRMLNEVRRGQLSEATFFEFRRHCSQPLPPVDGVLPSMLYTHNADVDRENEVHLRNLSGEETVFRATDQGPRDAIQELDKICPAPAALRLKPGAQVVVVWNMGDNIVNGTRGVVVGYKTLCPEELASMV
ncbi:hypothetical protein CYMTET_48236 [Cymbomonas tetramitiformis]|uniref:ATP-dependent DNA helicase n=1 Tax=Cymbomonas tetramitiformis TaxID=36881 RepID=A0AAE0BTQ7_9CHLO|nr:hypothetical protein CYMTET_48236 [Cymbomonas tetramitiformis]